MKDVDKELDRILATAIGDGARAYAADNPRAAKDALPKAKQDLLELMKGAVPPELEYPKKYLKDHSEILRATTAGSIQGWNNCRTQTLKNLGVE